MWRYIKVSNDARGRLGQIELQTEFDNWMKRNVQNGFSADNMAVLFRDDDESQMTTIYFTPEVEPFALTHGALACPEPSKSGLGILACGELHPDFFVQE